MPRRVAVLLCLLAGAAAAQDRRPRIDVEHYVIDAEVDPRTQKLVAKAEVRFVALDDRISSPIFELNNALTVTGVVDQKGQQVSASRNQQDFTVRLTLTDPLRKGDKASFTFSYEGALRGDEESPLSGIKVAAIHENYAYLLAPARWFPTTDYSTDRYTAEMRITAPANMRVIGSGIEVRDDASAGKATWRYRFTQPSFPGSIALVSDQGKRVSSQGVNTMVYFRGANQAYADAWGEEVGKSMTFLTGILGVPPQAGLSVIETEAGTPNGFAAPGLLFLSSKAIQPQPAPRLLVNQISRQWWGMLVSAATRNHLWIENGMARMMELLQVEQTSGPGALEAEVRDTFVEALTVNEAPLIQASRYEDYSPEFWAATAGKGAAVLQMLRYVITDEKFKVLLKTVPEEYAWKSIDTESFKRTAEKVAGGDLGYFFIQWIESNGAPEFKMEYTVFRTQKGFRVMGKIAQDLDTFRMPVDLKIETEGNPEEKRVEVMGTSSEFVVETFGRPKKVEIDAAGRVLRYSPGMRVAVAIRKGEQFAEIGEYGEALKEFQRALEVNRNSSLAHYRVGEVFFLQNNFQSAANEFRESLNGDLDPKWTEVWAHIFLGKIFDVTGQRERAVNEYNQAIRTKDNTQGAQEEAAKLLKEPYKRQRSSN